MLPIKHYSSVSDLKLHVLGQSYFDGDVYITGMVYGWSSGSIYSLVYSVNDLTGFVQLDANNLPYNNLSFSTVQSALDYLFQNSNKNLPSASILNLTFNSNYSEYLIGSTTSVLISWSYRPDINPLTQSYTLSYANYPDQSIWTDYYTEIITQSMRSFVLMNCSKSIKVDISYMDSFNQMTKSSFYIYFRNQLHYGKYEINQSNLQILIDNLQSKSLRNSYISEFQTNAGTSQNIYFACPSRMTTSYQPLFVVNHIGGGFTKIGSGIYSNSVFYTQDYVIYSSINQSLGHSFVQIRNPLNTEQTTPNTYIISQSYNPENLSVHEITASIGISSPVYYGDGSKLTGISIPTVDMQFYQLQNKHKSGYNSYCQFGYSGSLITVSTYWDSPGKQTKLFTENIYYSGSYFTQSITYDWLTSKSLTTSVIYDGNNITSVKKEIH